MPMLRERLQQRISSSLLCWVREVSLEHGTALIAFLPTRWFGVSSEYVGRRAGNTEKGRDILMEGSEEVQLLHVEGFFKCLYLFLLAESWDIGCKTWGN